jgi:hypothetical protein
MNTISNTPSIINSTGDGPEGWRRYWLVQSKIDGTDMHALLAQRERAYRWICWGSS